MLSFVKNGKGEILNLLFLNPDKKYYLAELAKVLGKEPSNYQKHIESFINEGVLSDERIGNVRLFWLNKNYQFYNEIKQIIFKTLGVEAQLKSVVESDSKIELAFIFGSFATEKFTSSSDIDLFLVGDIEKNDFTSQITTLENLINKDINFHIYKKEEVEIKLKESNDFLNRIFSGQKILLKGNLNEYY